MNRIIVLSILFIVIFGGISLADEPVDIIGSAVDKDKSGADASDYILETSWSVLDPFGEFDQSLGAAAALNRALGLMFEGNAAPEQIELEREMALLHENGYQHIAPFTVEVLDELQSSFEEAFPEAVNLKPFDLEPSEVSIMEQDGHSYALVRYDEEEYLERLLQRLYFKLIQGPVLLTVPYSGNAESVPEEHRNWNNFTIYVNATDTIKWDEVRRVYIDWDLTQTVVLKYEDGKIACYENDTKYYIDHTAAVATAGAMLAYPQLLEIADEKPLNYVLTSVEE